MKTKHIFLAGALAAALIAGMAQAKSDGDDAKRRAGESGKTVEVIFKTPPAGIVFEPDRQIEIAKIDTSSYRRIRVTVRPADRMSNNDPAYVWVYEGELEFPLVQIPTESTGIVDLLCESIILKGAFSPGVGSTPIHIVVYGER